MKKLYKKGKVHPTPPLISDHLAFLPATILTLTAALSPEDREVLAYLISCSGTQTPFPATKKNTQNPKTSSNGGIAGGVSSEHPPLFYCNCFRCYTSYWVRWDASPNRQLIHDIIDAFEDELTHKKSTMRNTKKGKKKRGFNVESNDLKGFEDESSRVNSDESESVQLSCVGDGCSCSCSCSCSSGSGGDDDDGDNGDREEFEKGSVRKFVSFIGETIWGVWN